MSEKLGKYDIRGILGRGAMGTVYDGWDPLIDRRVAIKTVKLQFDETDEEAAEAVARFKREAQAAGRLSHENIVGVFDYGETDEIAYIVMEFIEGKSLKSLTDPGLPLPPAQAGELMLQVLAGLDYSHRRGVVHRDIKPANVMLTTEGKVKLADFGIAKIASSSMTSVGVILGTPAYMPPEQFLGEPADARSDIYAAGAMLFHLLTGKRPYEGNPTSIMQKVLNAPAPPLVTERAAGISPAWDAVIAKAMARRPEDRFETAAAFAAAVREAMQAPVHAPVAGLAAAADEDATLVVSARAAAPRVSPPPPPVATTPVAAKKSGGLPVIPIAIGGLVVVAAGAGAAFFLMRSPAPSPAPKPTPVLPPPATQSVAKPVVPPAAPTPALPTPAAAAAQLMAATANIACTSVQASAGANGVTLTGAAGMGAPMDAVTKAAAGAGLPVSLTPVSSVPSVYCPALDVLRPVIRQAKLDFSLPENSPVSSSVFMHPTVQNLPFAGYLEVAYLSNDGTVFHVLPRSGDPSRLMQAGTSLRLGDAPHTGLQAGSPFGTDMIVAIETPKPLFGKLRTDGETVAAYAAALRAALAGQEQTAGGIVVLETQK